MTTDWTQKARALKVIVIILGVLIAVSLAILIVVVFQRVVAPSGSSSRNEPVTAAVDLPAGARVITMTSEDDTLLLLVETPGGRQQVITVDRRNGAVLGTLDLIPVEDAQ